jgi:hypothetical protein
VQRDTEKQKKLNGREEQGKRKKGKKLVKAIKTWAKVRKER